MIETVRHFHKAIKALYEKVDDPPWKIQIREGQGVHVLFFTAPDSPLQATITPMDAGVGGRWESSYTGMHIPGNPILSDHEEAWVARLHAAMLVLDEDPRWQEMVQWAMTRPGISIKTRPENKGAKETSGDELLIRIIEQCNAACDFCGCIGITSDYATQEMNIRERLLEGYAEGTRRVAFTGGEPTLVKALPSYVSMAKEIGFEWVNIQTNGVRLEDRELAQSLAEAGTDSLLLSLHSHVPEIHDQIIKIDGGFHQAVEGVRNALRSGINVGLNYVINRDNVDALPGYMEYVCGLWESVEDNRANEGITVTLSYVSPVGWTLEHLELIPKITEAAPKIAAALQTAENWGVEARIPGLCGIPLCILPGYEAFFDEFYDDSPALISTREYVDACGDCEHKNRCSGYWTKYYDLYGTDEFGLGKPRDIPPRQEDTLLKQEDAEALRHHVAQFLVSVGVSGRDCTSRIPIPEMALHFNKTKVPCPGAGRWSEKRCLQLLEALEIPRLLTSANPLPPWLNEKIMALKSLNADNGEGPSPLTDSAPHKIGRILDMEFQRQSVSLVLSTGPDSQMNVDDEHPKFAYQVTSTKAHLEDLTNRLSREHGVSFTAAEEGDSDLFTCIATVGTRKGRRIISRWERESDLNQVPLVEANDLHHYLLAHGISDPAGRFVFHVDEDSNLVSMTPLEHGKTGLDSGNAPLHLSLEFAGGQLTAVTLKDDGDVRVCSGEKGTVIGELFGALSASRKDLLLVHIGEHEERWTEALARHFGTGGAGQKSLPHWSSWFAGRVALNQNHWPSVNDFLETCKRDSQPLAKLARSREHSP